MGKENHWKISGAAALTGGNEKPHEKPQGKNALPKLPKKQQSNAEAAFAKALFLKKVFKQLRWMANTGLNRSLATTTSGNNVPTAQTFTPLRQQS